MATNTMPQRRPVRSRSDSNPRRPTPSFDGHANVLVEWYGVHTALAMARFYATESPAGAYWSDVLATLTARFPQPEQAEARKPSKPAARPRAPAVRRGNVG
jgi:hypothetical protein